MTEPKWPLIAIVGSAEPGRDYSPPLADCELIHTVARAMGGALMRARCRILVYASGPQFIEEQFVAGYVAAGLEGQGLVQIRYPSGFESLPFREESTHPLLFERRPDSSADWEVSFYRSLIQVDGMVSIAGGPSAKVAGIVSIAARQPLMMLASFGGGTKLAWDTLDSGDLLTHEERAMMNSDWPADPGEYNQYAEKLVAALLEQVENRKKRQTRTRLEIAEKAIAEAQEQGMIVRRHHAAAWGPYAAALMGAVLLMVPFAFGTEHVQFFLLALLPFLAGGAGSITRFITQPSDEPPRFEHLSTHVSLGMVAGGVSGLLFIGMQLFNYPQPLGTEEEVITFANHARKLVILNSTIGFVAGLTWDRVFVKLGSMDVVATDALTQALATGAEKAEEGESEA